MTTLGDIRTALRLDLGDPGALHWDDDALDRHIARALSELGTAIPRELAVSLATTPGSRELSLASIDGLIEVEAVEYPAGLIPPAFVRFATWNESLTLHTAGAPDGSDVLVFCTALHTLDGTGTTLPPHLEHVLATGAAAYAGLEMAARTGGQLNLNGNAPETYAGWARARLTAFHQLLRAHGRKGRIRGRSEERRVGKECRSRWSPYH